MHAVAVDPPAQAPASRRWTVGFVMRLVVVSLVFLLLVYNAADTLIRAIGHLGYHFSFHDSTSAESFDAPAPSLEDAGWAFLVPASNLA